MKHRMSRFVAVAIVVISAVVAAPSPSSARTTEVDLARFDTNRLFQGYRVTVASEDSFYQPFEVRWDSDGSYEFVDASIYVNHWFTTTFIVDVNDLNADGEIIDVTRYRFTAASWETLFGAKEFAFNHEPPTGQPVYGISITADSIGHQGPVVTWRVAQRDVPIQTGRNQLTINGSWN